MMINPLPRFALAGVAGLLLAWSHTASAQDAFVPYYAQGTVEEFAPAGSHTDFAIGLSSPFGAAFDQGNNLFVAEMGGNDIVKFAPDGTKTVFANTNLDGPDGLAFDAAGNLFVANATANTVVKFAPDGTGSVFARTGLNNPVGLAFDAAGNLYVANKGSDTIEKFTKTGASSVFASTGLNEPTGVAFDAAGNLFVTNFGDNTVEKFTPGGAASQFASTGLSLPTGLAFDKSGDLYVTNTGDDSIYIFGKSGTVSQFASTGATLNNPSGIAFPFVPPSTFFNGETSLGKGVYYLDFPGGKYFGYYSFLTASNFIYHFDLGYEYVFDAADGKDGVFFYDFTSKDFFYTSPAFPFPYLYDFNLKTVLYYYPDPSNPGHYNTKGVRYFYDFATGKIISK